MTDLVLNAICGVLLIFITATVVICMLQCADKCLARAYFMVGFCVFGWLFSVILYRITEEESLALFFDNLAFVFIAFLPAAILVMIAFFYKQGKHITPRLIVLLSIVPFFTLLVVLIPPLNFLLRYGHVMLSVSPLHIANYTWNWWFYVHLAHSYLITAASVVLVVNQHRKQPSGYALPSGLLVASISLTILGNIITLINSFEVDWTMITSCVGIVLLYIAIANNPSMEYLAIARKELFNSMDDAVFVINNQRQVLDLNASALYWLDLIGFSDQLPYEFEKILSHLSKYGVIINKNPMQPTDKSVFLQLGDNQIVYTLAERYVTDIKGRIMGSCIALKDITYYSKMITQFEQEAEIDPLTKINNRRVYERQCAEMDVAENLPLSIMIADVNDLKKVNDQLGHQYGDELLRVVAKSLECKCPENAVVARIGGDEFALILPCCPGEEIYALIEEIKELLRQEKNNLFAPSVALGAATKTSIEQDLQALIREADKAMYQQKEYDRRGRGSR